MLRFVFAVFLVGALVSLSTCQVPAGGFTEYPDCVSGLLSSHPICNVTLPMLERAFSLVRLLNTSEKVTRVGESYGSNGIARIGLPIHHFRQNAIHGLGPGVLWTPAGQLYSNCTVFPHIIGIGATFNRQLIHAMAEVISNEARAYANVGRAGLDWFTPNINVYRGQHRNNTS
jgi:beta-D-xylosidase 4